MKKGIGESKAKQLTNSGISLKNPGVGTGDWVGRKHHR
jgi:hypothetical protein